MTHSRVYWLLATLSMCVACSSTKARTTEEVSSVTASLSTVSVTQGGDELRTSWYPDEPNLSPSIVAGSTFGQLFSTAVTGQVYAQPLVSQGTVFIATEANNVYGLDAQTGAVQWSRSLGTPFAASDIGCADLTPKIGVTGTPVIDRSTNTAYLFSKSYQSGTSGAATWTAHAIDVATGQERAGFPVLVSGVASNDTTQVFAPKTELQRPGLLLLDGVVYAGFGSQCDLPPWAGWLVGVSTAGQLKTMWVTEAGSGKTNGGGIWHSGGGLVSDGSGQILFSTGNGGTSAGPIAGNTPPGTLGEAVVRTTVQADGTLKATDFFSPYDAQSLDQWDGDLGSGGPVGLPSPYFGTAQFPNLMTVVGKQGYVYLLNRDSLGGLGTGTGGGDAVVGRIGPYGGVWGKPAVWPGDGGYLYIPTSSPGTSAGGSKGNLDIFKYGLDGNGVPALSLVATSTDAFGFSSGSPVVTSNGTTSGSALVWVVWTVDGTGAGGQLRAYSAVPSGGAPVMVFNAAIGTSSKFASPGVAGNRVYVGTRDGHVIGFGAPLSTALSGAGDDFGNVIVGTSVQTTLTVTASSPVTVSSVTSSATPFVVGQTVPALPATLAAGATLSIPVTFTPQSPGMAAATITVNATGGAYSMSVTGTGQSATALLTAAPSAVSFGGTSIGGEIDSTVTFSNIGASPLTINSVTAPVAPFGMSGAPAAGTTLQPGSQVVVGVSFVPTAVGMFTGSISLVTSVGTQVVMLSGTSAPPGQLTVSTSSVAFGPAALGQTLSLPFTVSNTGGTSITITKSKPPALGVFAATTSLAEGTTLAPGASLNETVTFTPTAVGPATDAWVLDSVPGTGVQTLQFTGTGATDLTASGTPIALITNPAGSGSPNLGVIRDSVYPATGSTVTTTQYDTYTGATRTEDWIGYQFTSSQTFGSVVFQGGMQFADGGWFTTLNVQVLQGGTWVTVPGLTVSPAYNGNDGVNFEKYVLTFPAIAGTGIRIDGKPGGTATFISVGELRVYQAPGATAPVSVTAIAGPSQTVQAGASVTLDGSGSTASNGDPLTFAWTQTAGPTVTLSSASAVQPTFIAPTVTASAALTFSLAVIDGSATSAPSTVTITVNPASSGNPPGADITATASSVIALITNPTGSGSQNLGVIRDGVYPAVGSSTATTQYDTYTGATRTEDWIGYQYGATQTFGSVVFQDGMQFSNGGWFTTVRIQVLQSGTWVTVPGTTVSPAYKGNDAVNFEKYTFTFPSIAGTGIRIDGKPGGTSTFISVGELRVFQGAPISGGAPVTVVANAGANQSVVSGTTTTLNGSGSSASNGDSLAYAWTQTAGPTVALSNATAVSPTFVAPAVSASTALTFSLVAADGSVTSAASTVTITVTPPAPTLVAKAGPNQSVASAATVSLNGSSSSASNGDTLSYAWTQTAGPAVTLSNSKVVSPTFVAPSVTAATSLAFSLVVADGSLTSAPSTVTIMVTPSGTGVPTGTDITASASSIVALITKPTGGGNKSLSVIRDGVYPAVNSANSAQQYDTYNGAVRTADWIGYQYTASQTFGALLFEDGMQFHDGGFFTSIGVQVLQSGTWVTVPNVTVTPSYKSNDGVNYETYTLTFAAISGTGIRLYGTPGGTATFISVGELRAYTP